MQTNLNYNDNLKSAQDKLNSPNIITKRDYTESLNKLI